MLRLATSIKQGTVTVSLMLKKLASYPNQNGLAKALREIDRIEPTLFMLDWFRNPALRRRVQTGLYKGEAVTRWCVRYSCTGWAKSGAENWKIRATAPVD